MRAIILANGTLAEPDLVRRSLRTGDILLAADGGARHCLRASLVPQAVIGDFDSLSADELTALEAQGTQLVRHPARKDFTDLELALQYAVQLGCTQALVFAALGQRWDQTLANLLLPAAPGLETIAIRLIDEAQEITLVRPGETVQIEGQAGDTVSLIPISKEAAGILTEGLEYPLRGETLYLGATRGVSNVLVGNKASVKLESGLLLCTILHQPEK
jgi:thiamine pyrophosphokinase